MLMNSHQSDPNVQKGESALREDLLKGCRQIAKEIGETEPATYRMLESGQLPARKVGWLWFSTRSALRRHFDLSGEAA
jgi:hypothetical protein